MRKTLVTLVVGATVAIGAVASSTAADARWHRGFPVAPVVGGLAAGAILGAAFAAPRPYYSYAYEPVYFGPSCYVRRTDLGRMALALSPCRGMLLTQRRSTTMPVKKT
jgi:hypothetical protein